MRRARGTRGGWSAACSRRNGLSARVDRSRVFARVRAPRRRFERVFGVRVRTVFNNDTRATGYVVAGDRRLRLPRDLRRPVRGVVASFSRSTRKPGREVDGRPGGARRARH